MKTIHTKYLPYTNTKPSRIKAYTGTLGNIEHSLVWSIHGLPNVSSDETGYSDEKGHLHVARLLADSLKWKGRLIGGESVHSDYVFVFDDSTPYERTKTNGIQS